jgi:hypothetical protein
MVDAAHSLATTLARNLNILPTRIPLQLEYHDAKAKKSMAFLSKALWVLQEQEQSIRLISSFQQIQYDNNDFVHYSFCQEPSNSNAIPDSLFILPKLLLVYPQNTLYNPTP